MEKKVLCVIDVQKEYNTQGRPFYIEEIAESLQQAEKVLKFARNHNWVIAHIKHLQEGSIFSHVSPYSEFIENFMPADGESVFVKDNFSCFSNKEFTEFLSGYRNSEIYILGYGTTMCCVSTIIDGYHRGFKINFIEDASNAKPTINYSSKVLHSVTTEVLKTFATIKLANELCLI